MRISYKRAVILIFAIVLFIVFLIFLPKYSTYVGLLASILAILSFLIPKKDNNAVELERIIEDFQIEKEKEVEDKNNMIQKLSTDMDKTLKKLEKEKEKTKKLSALLHNVGFVLNRENISKPQLIKNIANPLKAIVFLKIWEDPDLKWNRQGGVKLFNEKVYPEMHIYGVRAGLSILPPKFVPQTLSNEKIIEWFLEEIEKRVPKGYQYNLPFISVVDLKDTASFKRLDPVHKRGHFSYLDKIPIEELAPPKMIFNFLSNKKHISVREIIDIPNLLFLIDETYISTEDNITIKKNNEKIVDSIKRYLQTEKFLTTDLANINQKKLQLILTKHGVKESSIISNMIIQNAKVWKKILERQEFNLK